MNKPGQDVKKKASCQTDQGALFCRENNIRINFLKGKTMPNFKNADEYVRQQQAAIASNPDCGNSHYNLAVGYIGQKKYAEAEKELHEAISCSPNLAEAYVQLGRGVQLHSLSCATAQSELCNCTV